MEVHFPAGNGLVEMGALRVCNGGAFGTAISGGGTPSSFGDVLVYEAFPSLGIAG